MNRLLKFGLTVLGIIAVWKLAAPFLAPSVAVRYKLSVDVDDNGVIRHGEGVIGVVFQSQGPLLIGNSPQWSAGVRGEAFSIEIGKRGSLFVLLGNDRQRNERDHLEWNAKNYSPEAGREALAAYFGFAVNDLANGVAAEHKINAFAASGSVAELEPAALPMLARFANVNAPKTVERIDPNHLDASFGSGVRIARATARITEEPETKGVEQTLVWLKALGDRSLGGTYLKPAVTFSEQLNVLDFKRGF